MTFALDSTLPSDLLSNLIVVDIAPSIGALSPEFQGYIEAMKKIEASQVKTRQEADHLLRPFEQVRPPSYHRHRPRDSCARGPDVVSRIP